MTHAIPSLKLLVALAVAGPLTASAASSWKHYFGENNGGSNSTDSWRETARTSYPLAIKNAAISNSIDPGRLDEVLAVNDWINLQDGYNYRQIDEVTAFFAAIRADHAAGWRANCTQLAQAMVAGHARNPNGHRALWELGNEIYAGIAAEVIGTWVADSGLPYPHPNSNYNDNPSHAERVNDRGILGYQIEYQIAPALEALLAVNATVPVDQRIRILSPATTVSSVNGGWFSALLDYRIVGYEMEIDGDGQAVANLAKPLASSLAGQRLGDLIDLINVHYLVGPNASTLATVFDNYVSDSTAARGVWHTEEGGIKAASDGRGGMSAMSSFPRAMDLWLDRGIDAENARLCFYASDTGPAGTRGSDALDILDEFMPAETTVLVRRPGIVAVSGPTVESYAFDSEDGGKRALFILPTGNSAGSFTRVSMQAAGWTATSPSAVMRLWQSAGAPTETSVAVTAEADGSYSLTFPTVDFTGQNAQALVIFLSGASTGPSPLAIATAATLPGGSVGVGYTQALSANGGTPPYTWTLTSGSLPTGLALGATGSLSGNPTAADTFGFGVAVTDQLGTVATRTFALTINASSTTDGPVETLADGSEGHTTTYVTDDGEVIAAYVRKPPGDGPFPLVLLVHGGGTSPSGTYSLGRMTAAPLTQLLEAGFVVYSMDFSAAPGSALSDGEWRLAAAALRTAIQLPYVDRLRVGMVGQSHGGNLTSRAASHLDILCAVPCAPAGIDPLAAWRFTQNGGTISANLQGVVDSTAASYGVPIETLAANPAAYGYRDVTDDAPDVRYPLFLVSGINDTSSPPDVMNDYGEVLAAAGKIFETYYPDNGPHGFVISKPNIPETEEFARRTVVFLQKYFSQTDSDADGLPDGWEWARFNGLSEGAGADPDGDGQNNYQEYQAGTHPLDASSVGDGGGVPEEALRIAVHPVSVTVEAGATVQLSVTAGGGSGPLSYVWRRDDVVVPGTPGSELTLADIEATAAGAFKVTVSDGVNAVESRLARVTVAPPQIGRLINMSVRSLAGVDGNPLIVGAVVPNDSLSVLIRAVGPSLADFKIEHDYMPDPRLTVYHDQKEVLINDNWSEGDTSSLSAVFGSVGAFPLTDHSSLDAAAVTEAQAATTVHVSDTAGRSGIVLVELYDLAIGNADQHLINVSGRNRAGPGAEGLVAGFVVNGNVPKRMLVRGIGPTLKDFKVEGTMADPQLVLHEIRDGEAILWAENNDWGNEYAAAETASLLGAFPLPLGSADAVLVVTLPPGIYTASVTPATGGEGEALVEVYEVP